MSESFNILATYEQQLYVVSMLNPHPKKPQPLGCMLHPHPHPGNEYFNSLSCSIFRIALEALSLSMINEIFLVYIGCTSVYSALKLFVFLHRYTFFNVSLSLSIIGHPLSTTYERPSPPKWT